MGSIRARGKLLFIDFRYRGTRCREQTKLTDTPANRKRLLGILERVEAEILLGTFSYEAYWSLGELSTRCVEVTYSETNISNAGVTQN
jgi:integrase